MQRKGKGASVAATTAPAGNNKTEEETVAAAAATVAAQEAAAATADGTGGATTTTTTTTPHVVHPYESNVKVISTVKTVEEFWATYNYLKRPSELSSTTDYHFFRAGIKPTWEDEANSKGGKWIVRLPKGLASRYWEEVLLAFVGGQFAVPDGEVCGLVVSIRHTEDILGIWNKNANDKETVERLRESIKKILPDFPAFAYHSMEYKPHNQSMADRTSFRNAHQKPPSTWNKARSGSWGERDNSQGINRRQSDHRGGWR